MGEGLKPHSDRGGAESVDKTRETNGAAGQNLTTKMVDTTKKLLKDGDDGETAEAGLVLEGKIESKERYHLFNSSYAVNLPVEEGGMDFDGHMRVRDSINNLFVDK